MAVEAMPGRDGFCVNTMNSTIQQAECSVGILAEAITVKVPTGG